MNIGRTIRSIRQRKRITILQLAEGTGLSKGFISNIETNKTSPSISTLEAIANYLRVPLPYLLLAEDQCMRIVRRDQREITTSGAEGLKVQHLTSRGPLRMMNVEFPPGSSTGNEPHTHPGEECHLVLHGTFLAEQGEHSEILHEGDSFSWSGSVPHFVKNVGHDTGHILIALFSEGDVRQGTPVPQLP